MTAAARPAHVSVRNTFINLVADDTDADGVPLRTKSGTPLRADSDPTGRSCVKFGGNALHDPSRGGLDCADEPEFFDCDEGDDDGDGPLLRTESYLGSAKQQRIPGRELKNSFRHVGDDTDADGDRLCTPLVAVREEEAEDEDDTPGLERFSTYDPFNPVKLPSSAIVVAAATTPLACTAVSDSDESRDDGDAQDEILERLSTYDPYGAPAAAVMLANSAPLPTLIPSIGDAAVPLMAAPMFYAYQPFPYHLAALQGPPVGALHSFHKETEGFGAVSHDFRQFTKGPCYEGRLSVLSESKVHTGGVHKFLVQFSGGQLTKADGVGFVFASRLPCTKNIQKIVSIFVNKSGQICMRAYGYVLRGLGHVRTLKVGDWIELEVDLDTAVATFGLWRENPNPNGKPDSYVEVAFGKKLGQAAHKADVGSINLHTGHFACVVQNVGVTVTIGS